MLHIVSYNSLWLDTSRCYLWSDVCIIVIPIFVYKSGDNTLTQTIYNESCLYKKKDVNPHIYRLHHYIKLET